MELLPALKVHKILKIYEPKGTKENNKKSAKNTFIAHPFTHTLIYYCTN